MADYIEKEKEGRQKDASCKQCMNKTTLARILLCVIILGVLIASAFIDVNQLPTGDAVAIGRYIPAGVSETTGDAVNGAKGDSGQERTLMQAIADVNDFLNSNVAWGIFMCTLLVGTGVYLSFRSGFMQLRHFGYIMENTIGKLFAGKRNKKTADDGAITPFQALCTALAATVGTGNIAGVAGAIVLGGPGAVFWMWMAAFMGMCTKYAEIVLAVKFREKNSRGEWVGGPMYYIKNGLGKGWSFLGAAFSVLGAIASFGIGSMTQVNTIAGTFIKAVDSVAATEIAGTEAEKTLRLMIGLIIAALAGLVIIGGIKRLGRVTEKIVPVMSAFYILGALVVIVKNAENLGMVFDSIFRAAFTREAAFGGVGGFVFMTAVKRGVGRGVFSNEAGLGSAPMAHASSSEADPVRQGFYGVFEVFADTIVICTLTALVILSSGVVHFADASMAGAETTILAFSSVFGSKVASLFIAVAILFFAFSTILSWSLYGRRCFGYLTKNRGLLFYEMLFLITIVLGATLDLSLVWNIADTLNGFMAVPNLIAILALSGTVASLTREHFSKVKTLK